MTDSSDATMSERRTMCEVCDKIFKTAEEATACRVHHEVLANYDEDLNRTVEGGNRSIISSPIEFQTSSERSANSTSSKKHGGRRNELWDEEAIAIFVDLIKKNYDDLTGKYNARINVWKLIQNLMQTKIPGITVKQLQSKWKNLKTSYLKYRGNQGTSGAEFKKPPSSYENMCTFLSQRPLSNPQTISAGLEEIERTASTSRSGAEIELCEVVMDLEEDEIRFMDDLASGRLESGRDLESGRSTRTGVSTDEDIDNLEGNPENETRERPQSRKRKWTPNLRGQVRARPLSHSKKMENIFKSVQLEMSSSNARMEEKLADLVDNQRQMVQKQAEYIKVFKEVNTERTNMLKIVFGVQDNRPTEEVRDEQPADEVRDEQPADENPAERRNTGEDAEDL